ncbi:hypothetical protein EGT07_15670 [Herbaspirillum sp. HC18]|nr:hypothetical protein EGT07_15670 [Herbaspirillum sp. HC18]
MTTNRQRRILVSRWASMTYGAYAPTAYALKCWIEKGWIHPSPTKIRGKWFVEPTAEYKERGGRIPSEW